ncbi:EamA family transporter [Bradyrhizobium sp. 151]|nr:EamA family transporter [Bradyrhizobium sp. 151]
MSASAFYGLVLFSAVAHAIWNSLVKSAGDRTLTMVMIRFSGFVLGLAALPFVDWPYPESWKWLFLTAGVQFGYYALLLRSYGLGDLSMVYPLARGIAPILTTIAAFVALGETIGPVQFSAVALISFGIMLLSLGAGTTGPAVGWLRARRCCRLQHLWRIGRADGRHGPGFPSLPGDRHRRRHDGLRVGHTGWEHCGARSTTWRHRPFCRHHVRFRVSRLSRCS